MLAYPGLILIDHGHFQYNGISLGLMLFAVTALFSGRDCLGSALFVAALNYKQVTTILTILRCAELDQILVSPYLHPLGCNKLFYIFLSFTRGLLQLWKWSLKIF